MGNSKALIIATHLFKKFDLYASMHLKKTIYDKIVDVANILIIKNKDSFNETFGLEYDHINFQYNVKP